MTITYICVSVLHKINESGLCFIKVVPSVPFCSSTLYSSSIYIYYQYYNNILIHIILTIFLLFFIFSQYIIFFLSKHLIIFAISILIGWYIKDIPSSLLLLKICAKWYLGHTIRTEGVFILEVLSSVRHVWIWNRVWMDMNRNYKSMKSNLGVRYKVYETNFILQI